MTIRARLTQPRLLPSVIALAALAAVGAVQAQSTPAAAPAKDAKQLDTVVVTGFRASLESALNKKREDSGIVDVIKAEDIAKFPDTNLAESLQRIPGVVIDRDAGEGRNITVRGLGQDFTRVRINGVEALATTGGTDSSGGANRSRGFDFNVFASELFNQITVRKSSSADVDEGSLGATVDLQTSRPFDFKNFTASVSVKERYNDLSRTTDPRMAFLISDTFLNRKVGLLFSVAKSKRTLYEEGFSTVRWDNGASSGGWCAPGTGTCGSGGSVLVPGSLPPAKLPVTADNSAAYAAASSANNFHPRLPRYGRLTHDQDRLGMTGSLQVRASDSTLVTLDMLFSQLKATRQEDFLEAISFSRSAAQGGKPQTSVVSASYDANGALLQGVYNGVDIRAESRFDVLKTTFSQPTLTIEHEFSDTLRMNAKLGRASSRFNNPVQTTTTLDALNVNGYSLDFRGNDRLPVISYPFDPTVKGGALQLVGVPVATSGTQAATVSNATTSEIRIRPQGANNQTDLGHLDFAWDVIPNGLTLRAGYDAKKYLFKSWEFRRVNQNDTIFPSAAGSAALSTMLTGFGNGMSLPGGTPTSWVIPDLNAIAAAYDIYCNCIKSGPAGGPG
ncbi:MAG TPA: TonB-dependent receptor, partial [Burkholderiaceae bacterium]